MSKSTPLTPEEYALLSAHVELRKRQKQRAAVNERRTAKNKDRHRRSSKAAAIRNRRASERLEARELENRPAGPNLPMWMFSNPRVYVQTRELVQELQNAGNLMVEHREELRARADADGLEPVDVFLRTLLSVLSEHVRDGVGLQGPKEDLAELAHVHRATVYRSLERLTERKDVLMRGRRRRYVNLSRQLDASQWFTDAQGQRRPLSRWKDGSGKRRKFIDTHGVLYATSSGVTATRRRERNSRGELVPHGLWATLWRTLRPLFRRLRARLATASAPLHRATPDAVELREDLDLLGRGDRAKHSALLKTRGGADPPA